MGLFSRRRKQSADTGSLGASLIALRLDAGDIAPAGTTVVIFNAAGQARRVTAGRVVADDGETAFCFHAGPYTVDLLPFAAAPEWGLRLRFVIDAANPRVAQQRFDLYLYSEMEKELTLAGFGAAAQLALQTELAQGGLDLPPCTTLEEWHAFRAGLNQLMYTRYGVTVDDCVPVDLGEQRDFADVLKARAERAAEAQQQTVEDRENSTSLAEEKVARVVPDLLAIASTATLAQRDAQALRRLFVELPALSSQLRALTPPEGTGIFQQHQDLLLRMGLACLSVNTMPALAWAAPDQPLEQGGQRRRCVQGLAALQALDEAWALLARLQIADGRQWPALLDDGDRICANLENGLTLRRMPHVPDVEPVL